MFTNHQKFIKTTKIALKTVDDLCKTTYNVYYKDRHGLLFLSESIQELLYPIQYVFIRLSFLFRVKQQDIFFKLLKSSSFVDDNVSV